MSFSQALLHATTKLKVLAAILPGPWHPAVVAKQLATIDHISNGRIAINVVSGWFKGEFTAIGEPWLEHETLSALEGIHPGAEGHLDAGQLHVQGRLLPLQRLHAG